MRAVFGVVALMIVVGLVGMLRATVASDAWRHGTGQCCIRACHRPRAVAADSGQGVNDVAKAMEQAATRKDDAEK